MTHPSSKSSQSSRCDIPKKKRKKETDEIDKYFEEGEPTNILGLIEIDGKNYTLVNWGDVGMAYVSYNFMKKYYPLMILEFYQDRGKFKKY